MSADAITELAAFLARLPGVGERTSMRYAYSLLEAEPQLSLRLGKSLSELHSRVVRCQRCQNYTENAHCGICASSKRDQTTMCVVARVPDLMAFERSGNFRGVYHVLHGLLSPLEGIGPSALGLDKLERRVREEEVSEVIIATPLNVDGDATALFIADTLKDVSCAISRIASGVPHGGELEFTDQVTLSRAIGERKKLS